jgi:hypothetical protein
LLEPTSLKQRKGYFKEVLRVWITSLKWQKRYFKEASYVLKVSLGLHGNRTGLLRKHSAEQKNLSPQKPYRSQASKTRQLDQTPFFCSFSARQTHDSARLSAPCLNVSGSSLFE